MNYYNEIKNELLNNEINRKVKNYSINKSDLSTYYNVGKILSEAGKHYGQGIIKEYSKKLKNELGKNYSVRVLYKILKYYNFIKTSKLPTLSAKLSWSHYDEILKFDDISKILYYINISAQQNLSIRQLRIRIKSNEYERLSTYIKFPNLTKEEELECVREWINDADNSKYEKWVIEIKETGEIAGNIDVNTVVKKHNYCNVGYTIRYNYWGNGYAAEALKAVSDHLLNNSGYYLVECSCNERNVQSSRAMEKAGFKKDGYIANRRLNMDGTYSGVAYYSKTKS